MKNNRPMPRSRSSRQSPPKKDAFCGALLIQLFLSILLVASVFVLKNQHHFLYLDVHENMEQTLLSEEELVLSTYIQQITDLFSTTYRGEGGMWEIESSVTPLTPPKKASFAPFKVTGRMIMPLEDFTVTSPFGYRQHPISKKLDFHRGIDLAAPQGSDIVAPFMGEVSKKGIDANYGNFVEITHSQNLKTFYAHCEEILVEEGEKVSLGDTIATVGSTGISTGPHLHFEMIVEENFSNPMWIFEDELNAKM